MMGNRPDVNSEAENIRDHAKVNLCNGCIDLEFNPSFFQHFDSPKGAFKRTFHFPKGIVHLCIWAIEADADPLNPCGLHPLNRFIIDQGAVSGHHHTQPSLRSIEGQIENIGPEEGFSSCQDDDRLTEGRNLIDHPEAFLF
jgi:hypothetical protein